MASREPSLAANPAERPVRTRSGTRTTAATPPFMPSPPRRRYGRILSLLLLLALLGAALAWLAMHEARTSRLQARWIPPYAQSLTYSLEPGPSDAVRYPLRGPFDQRLGYSRLPDDLNRLQGYGFRIDRQVRFSPALMRFVGFDLYPPYVEKAQAGLTILDGSQQPLYRFNYPRRAFASVDHIPPLLVAALLFIEDRNLLDSTAPNLNPAVNWPRFLMAVAYKVGETLGLQTPSMGGSTLATQIEKYRHTDDGITSSIEEKLQQMVSASVRVYQQGGYTLPARRQLVLDYLNTVPLSAAPGFGEVNGIGDGLEVWFGANPNTVTGLLLLQNPTGTALQQQGLALRQVMGLMIAHRRPSYYLMQDRKALEQLLNAHLRLLAQQRLISSELAQAALQQQLVYRDFSVNPAVVPTVSNKGVNMARSHLAAQLGLSLYDLDRLDLTATTTLDRDLQQRVTDFLRSLSDPDLAEANGLVGEYLLQPGQSADLSYSFTLFKRSSAGNLVRVQTDNTDIPFDINEGSKLELGSTAKLRVLATYLGIVADLHGRFAGQSPAQLQQLWRADQDLLTRWALEQLSARPGLTLAELLDAAMARRYSASPGERFFTGGGMHTFNNFKRADGGRIPTVLESLQESINLPFVRMLRDIIKHITYQQWSDLQAVMSNDSDPRRQELLARFADKESTQFLSGFWNKYAGKSTETRTETLLNGLKLTRVRAAVIYRYLFPQADLASFSAFMRERVVNTQGEPAPPDTEDLASLYDRYGPDRFNLQDQGYLARVHPLELWLLGYLQRQPQATFKSAVADSTAEREAVYGWLLRTKAKNARDKRVRTMLEVEAFAELHRRWRDLGYPFDHLVPSLATALGSSGDRPAALAELMGIILNGGQRLPAQRITQLVFGAGTPYEVHLSRPPVIARTVMHPQVAATLKNALAQVVNDGTGRRLKDVLFRGDGSPLNVGGKTGTGDNRLVVVRGGQKVKLRALSRTATLVFYLGDNHFGTLTAFVSGDAARDFKFTSALPAQVLKSMVPVLQPYLQQGEPVSGRLPPADLQNPDLRDPALLWDID